MKPRAIDLNGPIGTLAPPATIGVMVLLDRSSSMHAIKLQMEAAFAEFIEGQKALDPEGMWLSLYQFDSRGYDTCYERRPLAEVPPLGLTPRGNTPLNDALFRFGTQAQRVVDDPDDQTERLLLVVITDGEENASNMHTRGDWQALLAKLEGPDCELLWLGTDKAVTEAVVNAYVNPAAAVAWTGENVAYATAGLAQSVTSFRAGSQAMNTMNSYTASDGQVDNSELDAAFLRARRLQREQTPKA